MKNLSFKSLLPHLVAIIIYLTISVIFFSSVIFENKVMTQNDIIQGISSGQEIIQYREETGKEALWTNSMFGGMPAYLINTQWSGDLIKHAHNILSLYLPSPARYTFLAMTCFYILLLVFKVNPYLAIAGGIAYGMNSFFIVSIEAGHIWKVSAISYMPLVLAGIQLIQRKKNLLGASLTGAAVSLMIRSNHIQIAYYLFLVLLVFWIIYLIDAIKNKTLSEFGKTTVTLTVAGLLGLTSNLGKIWTSAEYSSYTIRGKSELTSNTQSTSNGLDKDYAFAWSNGIMESFTFVIPYFYGGASQEDVGTKSKLAEDLRKAGVNRSQIQSISKAIPTYWGNQPFTSGPVYPGIIAVFLFVLGILIIKGPIKWWLVSATIFGFLLSWGKNFEWFNYFMFDYFPLYNKFRAVSMTLVIPLLCIPLLGFIGLDKFVKTADSKKLIRAVIITGGLLLFFLIISGMMEFKGPKDEGIQQLLLDAIINQRTSMFRRSTFTSLFFVLIMGGLTYFYTNKKISFTLLSSSIILLVFIDLYLVDSKYIDESKFSNSRRITAYQADDADTKINQDEEHYRVVNLTVNIFNDATTSYYHSSIGGYHGAKIRRYQDVIERHLNNELKNAVSQIQNGSYDLKNIPVINMLNTRYLKVGKGSEAVLKNSNALGNAWFVKEIKSVSNPDEAIASIGITDLKESVISEKLDSRSGLSDGSIELLEYKPNYLKYSSSNSGDGFAVFSEIFYEKGWKAKIDGIDTPIHQVNYILRGLEVPSGNHTIEFNFKPKSYKIGNTTMWVSSILCLGLLIFSIAMEFKKNH